MPTDGLVHAGNHLAEGYKVSTGSAMSFVCGFRPAKVEVINTSTGVKMEWTRSMGDGAGWKVGSGNGVNVAEGGSDIKGSTNTDAENADGTTPTNYQLLKAADTVTNFAGMISNISEPDVARNICITIINDSGGPLDLYEGVTTFTVSGAFRGQSVTETVTFTSTALDKTIADGKSRNKYTLNSFDKVNQISYDNAPAGALKIGIGPGSKFGLHNWPYAHQEAGLVKITKNAADYPTVASYSSTYNNVLLGTLVDGDDVQIVYAVGASGGLTAADGITSTLNGFIIGVDPDINDNGGEIYWSAHKFG